MRIVFALLAGVLMGLGLAISGMMNPAKVLGFLDLAGAWDPTLVLVMGGALATTWVGYRLAFKRPAPLFAPQFTLPTRRDIDTPLVVGAAVFGVGWGLVGFCPGPAIAALTSLRVEPFVFIAAMAVGMLFTKHIVLGRRSPGRTGVPAV